MMGWSSQQSAVATPLLVSNLVFISNLKRAEMFGRSSRMRAMSSHVADMERRMRMLERDTRRYAGDARRYANRGYAGAAQATEQVGDVVDAAVSALSDVIHRFRGNARSVGDEAARFGNEAARLGNSAVQRLTHEVEHRPLTMLAIVAGLGFLFGLAGRRG
jgi:hypothetical protein